MIIFGSKASHLASENIHAKCSNCETQNSIQMSVFQKYAHIFWIPFFPIGKTAVSQCTHCKQVLEKKEFNGNLQESYHKIKSNSKTPIWTFFGIGIATILIVWGLIASKDHAAKNEQLILSPEKGDIYEVKYGHKQYTLYKIDEIVGDTVFLIFNEYETNKISGLSELNEMGAEAYGTEALPVLKSDLKEMFESGEIIDVNRE